MSVKKSKEALVNTAVAVSGRGGPSKGSRKTFNFGWAILMGTATFMCLLSGCGHTTPAAQHWENTKKTDAPERIVRPSTSKLRALGQMAEAYRVSASDILVEVEFIPNQSGVSEKLPDNLSFVPRAVLGEIGAPFRTTTTYASFIDAPRQGATVLAYMAPLTSQAPVPPPPTVRLRGELVAFNDRVMTLKEARAVGLIDIRSSNADLQLTGSEKTTLKSLRVGLYFTTPDGMTLVEAPPVTYEAKMVEIERAGDASIFVNGSGAGVHSEFKTSFDPADLIFDLMASCMIKNVAYSMLLPGWRIDDSISQAELEANFRNSLAVRTREELNLKLWHMLFLHRLVPEMRSKSLSEGDRATLEAVCGTQGAQFSDRQSVVDLIVRLWASADYVQGSTLVRQAKQKAILAREEASDEADGLIELLGAPDTWASTFGLPSGTPCIVLDLRAIKSTDIEKVIAQCAKLPNIPRIVNATELKVAAIVFNGTPADFQERLRSLPDYRALWFKWSENRRAITVSYR